VIECIDTKMFVVIWRSSVKIFSAVFLAVFLVICWPLVSEMSERC
jgi:hypothetical protein